MQIIKLDSLTRPSLFIAISAMSIPILPMNSALAQDWQIEPTIKAGGEVDDNATLRSSAEEVIELEGAMVDILADINYQSPKSTFFVKPRVLLRRYSGDSDFDSNDIFLGSRYQFNGPVNTFGFRGRFDRQSVRTAERTDADVEPGDPGEIPDDETGRTYIFGDRGKWQLTPFWNYRLSSTTTIGAEINYADVSYDDIGVDRLVDYTDARMNLKFRRSFSPVTTGLITLTGRQFEPDTGDIDNQIDGVGAMVGFEHALTETLDLRAMIGVEDEDQAVADTDPEVVGNLALIRNLETIRLYAEYRRSISAGGAGRLELRDSGIFDFSKRLTEKFSAGLGVRAYRSRGIGVTEFDSDRDYVQFRASFAWYLTRHFALEADYRYSSIDRNRASVSESADSNRVTLWIVYRPNTVPKI